MEWSRVSGWRKEVTIYPNCGFPNTVPDKIRVLFFILAKDLMTLKEKGYRAFSFQSGELRASRSRIPLKLLTNLLGRDQG